VACRFLAAPINKSTANDDQSRSRRREHALRV
jgi:hypothetical protein